MGSFSPIPAQILPYDGEAHYYGAILSSDEADLVFEQLLEETPWKRDEVVIFGKKLVTQRCVAWYGDRAFHYQYAGVTKEAQSWTPGLLALKTKVEEHAQVSYNSCLLNLYHSGQEGMSWHRDNEAELLRRGAIASLSLGAERKFSFKHRRSKERIDQFLEKGSLLVMRGETQEHWLHSMPKTKKVDSARINLTFRTICCDPSS